MNDTQLTRVPKVFLPDSLDKVEIINSFTGKTVCNKYSRLTKQSMFRRFGRITGQLPGIVNRAIDKDYGEEKAAVVDYQVRSFLSFRLHSGGDFQGKLQRTQPENLEVSEQKKNSETQSENLKVLIRNRNCKTQPGIYQI